MIAYVTVGTNDFEKAKEFYGKLLADLDANPLMENERMVAWGKSFKEPLLTVCKPENGNPATVGNGTMVALACPNKEVVEALHAKALEMGGENEGEPGMRGGQFFMAYARDLDGNKLAFFAQG